MGRQPAPSAREPGVEAFLVLEATVQHKEQSGCINFCSAGMRDGLAVWLHHLCPTVSFSAKSREGRRCAGSSVERGG